MAYKDPSLPLSGIAARDRNGKLKKLLETGLPIAHVDGHHHAHLRPELFATVAALTAKYKIKVIRYFRGFYEGLYPGVAVDWIQDLVPRFGLKSVDTFFAGWEAVASSLPGYRYLGPSRSRLRRRSSWCIPVKGEAWREKELGALHVAVRARRAEKEAADRIGDFRATFVRIEHYGHAHRKFRQLKRLSSARSGRPSKRPRAAAELFLNMCSSRFCPPRSAAAPGTVTDIKDRQVGPFDIIAAVDSFPPFGEGTASTLFVGRRCFCPAGPELGGK